VKLPEPDFGTEAHPMPKSMAVAAEPEPAAAGAEEPAAAGAEEAAIVGLDEPEPDAAEELPLELQAAAPMARVSASPDTARSWCFTVISPVCLFVEPSGDGHHD
jgi:hypothetical protein